MDIFGFEIFPTNSLEQLCINYTNERLHQLYIKYVFKQEELVFIQEGLEKYRAMLYFNDNQPLLNLIADHGNTNIFRLLDDITSTSAKDETFMSQILTFHKDDKKIKKDKFNGMVFILNHTANDVTYDTNGFCKKNSDEVSRPIIECIIGTSNEKINDIYQQKASPNDEWVDYLAEKKNKKESYIANLFKKNMEELMSELESCHCSFMRTIKPNEKKSSSIWCSSVVIKQIRYLGLLDSIEIRKKSYPFRYTFKEFCYKYLE